MPSTSARIQVVRPGLTSPAIAEAQAKASVNAGAATRRTTILSAVVDPTAIVSAAASGSPSGSASR